MPLRCAESLTEFARDGIPLRGRGRINLADKLAGMFLRPGERGQHIAARGRRRMSDVLDLYGMNATDGLHHPFLGEGCSRPVNRAVNES
jgi:hypothetical protein